MIDFKKFATQIYNNITRMIENHKELFFLENINRYKLWNFYLNSFPAGTNNIYRERREYDCSTCRQFIFKIGHVISIDDNLNLHTIWEDNNFEYPYNIVAKELDRFIRKHFDIEKVNRYLNESSKVGQESNIELLESGETIEWNHFWYNLPKKFVEINSLKRNSKLSEFKGNLTAFINGFDVITKESCELVLDLINENQLYRGDQYKRQIVKFKNILEKLENISDDKKDLFILKTSMEEDPSILKIKNTSIGLLLQELSKGEELESAVRSFEKIVAPENYQRSKSIVTKKMVEDAKKTLEELGLLKSIYRRHCTKEDINVNEVLYVDKPTFKLESDLFDELIEDLPDSKPDKNKLPKIKIEDFIKDVLPKINKLEVLFENKHETNLMSIIGPKYPESGNILKWNNPYSWTYNGNLADSIKQKVKAAGGKVDAILRASLAWENLDDLDIHCKINDGIEIYYSNTSDFNTRGRLDVDMNVRNPIRGAVENIYFPDLEKLKENTFEIIIHNYKKRESRNPGFKVELEFLGQQWLFTYDKDVESYQYISVIKFKITKNGELEIIDSIENNLYQSSRTIWNISTNKFHKCILICNSPNHWGENNVGAKHYFFILENCKTDEPTRGFFNEQLKSELNKHRKVFEILGSKSLVEPVESQLSGLGFIATKRNDLVVKVQENGKQKLYCVEV